MLKIVARFLLCALSIILIISVGELSAQTTVRPGNKIGWTQTAIDLAEASSFTYKYYIDTSNTGVLLTNVVCTAIDASNFDCIATFPAVPNGNHTIALTAANQFGESGRSTALTFQYGGTPSIPRGLRIVAGI